MKCHCCHKEFTPTPTEMAAEFGARTSKRKSASSARNGKLGGRPSSKGNKRPDPKVK